MPCEPDLTTFSATGAVTPMTTAEIAGGFGQCSEPKPTTGRLNFVLNWLTCHVLGMKDAIEEASPCTATPATTAQIAGIDLNDRVVVCADGSSAGFQLGDLPFATSAELEAIAPCTAPAITAAEQAALDADLSTGAVTVCIPDGAGKKAVSVALDALLGGGGGGGAGLLGALGAGDIIPLNAPVGGPYTFPAGKWLVIFTSPAGGFVAGGTAWVQLPTGGGLSYAGPERLGCGIAVGGSTLDDVNAASPTGFFGFAIRLAS